MASTCTDNKQYVYELCQKHFGTVGIMVKPPAGTPLQYSYLWKHVCRLTEKFESWGFNENEVDNFIRIGANRISGYPPRHRTVQKLLDNDMLDYCSGRLKDEEDQQNDVLKNIMETHKWLLSVSNGDIRRHLLKRYRMGALPNLVLYYRSGQLSKLYIAFSSICLSALATIEQSSSVERSMCPTGAELYRYKNYKFKQFAPQITNIIEGTYHG